MTYRAPENFKANKYREDNWRDFPSGEKLRCHQCNSIHWRVFYNALQCMGCRSWTAFEMEKGDFADIQWVKYQFKRYKDGRIHDPISRRTEFVVEQGLIRSRISGTDLLLPVKIAGTYLMKSWPRKKPKTLKGPEIMRLTKNG